ncbi:MAG TPA: hemerythrin domain-containing protein [Methylophilus sp.]
MSIETSHTSPRRTSVEKQSAVDVSHNVIVLLKQDHASVKKMFSQFEKCAKREDHSGKLEIANTICVELLVHMLVEEEIFYPAARQVIHDDDMLNEANVEHASAKDLIAQIQATDPTDALYDAKIKVLSEYILHHVKEEETELFPRVRATRQLDLKQMATLLTARRKALMAQLYGRNGKADTERIRRMAGMGESH